MSLKRVVSVYDIQQEIKDISSITQYSQISVHYKTKQSTSNLHIESYLGLPEWRLTTIWWWPVCLGQVSWWNGKQHWHNIRVECCVDGIYNWLEGR